MNNAVKETVYSPESLLLYPGKLMSNVVSNLMTSRELAVRLLIRNLSAQYRQSLLGYLWAFIPPIFMAFIWVFLNAQKIFTVGETGIPYPAFALIGTVLWQTFVDSINSPAKIFNESKPMLAKINFQYEALILAGAGEVAVNFFIRLILLVCIFVYYRLVPPATILFLPLGILSLMCLGFMIGILLTPLSVLYNDFSRGIVIATQAWFFLTPVVYPLPKYSIASIFIGLNPVTPVLVTAREWMTTGHAANLSGFMLISIGSFTLMILGWLLLRLSMPHLIARISA